MPWEVDLVIISDREVTVKRRTRESSGEKDTKKEEKESKPTILRHDDRQG